MGNKDPDLFWFLLLVFAALSLDWHCFNADGNGRKMLSCQRCSSPSTDSCIPVSRRRVLWRCFPAAQQSAHLPPWFAKDTSPPRVAGSPLAWPRMWPLHLYPLGHPLALQKQLLAGFSKNLSGVQALEGERCAQLVKTKLAIWCNQVGILGQAEPASSCARYGTGSACPRGGSVGAQSGFLPAERCGDILGSSISLPRRAGTLESPCSWAAGLSLTRCFLLGWPDCPAWGCLSFGPWWASQETPAVHFLGQCVYWVTLSKSKQAVQTPFQE